MSLPYDGTLVFYGEHGEIWHLEFRVKWDGTVYFRVIRNQEQILFENTANSDQLDFVWNWLKTIRQWFKKNAPPKLPDSATENLVKLNDGTWALPIQTERKEE